MESESKTREPKPFSWDPKDNSWAIGIALILVGALFLLDTFDILNINLTNWWAVFLLVPGLNMTLSGWRRYGTTGSKSGRRTGMWGMALIIMAFAFFFNIAWSWIFPVVLIGAGIYFLFFR